MIIVDAGQRDEKAFDAKIIFASQLARSGHHVAIDEKTAPQTIDRIQKYEVVPFLTDVSDMTISGLVLIGAENISDEMLMTLRSYNLGPGTPVSATGRFVDHQTYLSASSKIAFALGREANMIDLNELQKKQILRSSTAPLSAVGDCGTKSWANTPELFLFLPTELLDDPMTLSQLGVMRQLAEFNLNVICTGTGKEQISESKHTDISVYGITELSPAAFARVADIAVFFGDGVPGERMAIFSLEVMQSAGVLIDCTVSGAFASSGAPALRGPEDLAALPNYLRNKILPNCEVIGRQAKSDSWLANLSIQRLMSALMLPAVKRSAKVRTEPAPQTIFVPTNGAGMGHAQRCSLIAADMKRRDRCRFAAFPKCIPLISSKGFASIPLVQKSEFHSDEYANDLVNYLRLRRTLRDGDNLVFDGGYVFDSVYRTIMEKSLSATWVRRGLWQVGQIRKSSLEREKAFDRVIVPSELFEELNTAYTLGKNIHQIGPIVQRSGRDEKDVAKFRTKLKSHLKHEFDELVVTMLGAGVAADRSAQMQAICAQLDLRPKCLHLIVMWPGSILPPSVHSWKNMRMVATKDALALCQAADLVVSAVGYNSFHEILYHNIPAIFIPQTAPYFDDQEKRARAASERGLAATVLAKEILLLEREVAAFLDEGKSDQVRRNIDSMTFPARGNGEAAALIDAGTIK